MLKIEEIVERLKQNDPSLTYVMLDSCNLSIGNIVYLCKALKTNHNVRKLILRINNIQEGGAGCIADLIKVNTTIEVINLRSNEIGDRGVRELARALEKNQTLQEINLNYNYITDKGANTLVAMLEKNDTLKIISLSNNYISKDLLKKIQISLNRNALKVALNELERNRIVDHSTGQGEVEATSTPTIELVPPLAATSPNEESVLPLVAAPIEEPTLPLNQTAAIASSSQNNSATITEAPVTDEPSDMNQPLSPGRAPRQLTVDELAILELLQRKYKPLSRVLSNSEKQITSDLRLDAELLAIAEIPEAKLYYEMMRKVVERTLIAAMAISSGGIGHSATFSGSVVGGIFTLSMAATDCIKAKAVLGALKVAAGIIDENLKYQEMCKYLTWTESDEFRKFAKMLARQLAIAQKNEIDSGNRRIKPSLLERMNRRCVLLSQELKSGVTFGKGERLAILDAQKIFKFMKDNDCPMDMGLNGRVAQILCHIMHDPKYIYVPPALPANDMVQLISDDDGDFAVSIPASPARAKQSDVDALNKTIQELKEANRVLMVRQVKNEENMERLIGEVKNLKTELKKSKAPDGPLQQVENPQSTDRKVNFAYDSNSKEAFCRTFANELGKTNAKVALHGEMLQDKAWKTARNKNCNLM